METPNKEMHTKEPESWEEEFDDEFPNSRGIFENGDPYDSRRKSIKDFIRTLLARQREEIVEECIRAVNGEISLMDDAEYLSPEDLTRALISLMDLKRTN